MSKKKYRKVCRQWIAWLLCIAVLFQSVPVYAGETKETYGESQIKTTGQEESVMDWRKLRRRKKISIQNYWKTE